MKRLAGILVVATVIMISWTISSFENVEKTPLKQSSFAVVELFTSQGCSSCPSADRVLSTIIDKKGDKPIYGLSFHVSYWNYLGWKDPYSSEVYTKRQKDYSNAFRSSTIYTPQMIVNGKQEFVGSNGQEAESTIENSLEAKSDHAITAEFQNQDGKSLDVTYHLSGPSSDYVVNTALVERDITNNVPRGENGGRTLHHDNVVRAFKTVSARANGTVEIEIPAGLEKEKSAIIVYVQNQKTMEIVAAAEATLL